MKAFGWLLHAEWTKFRTVRGWVIAIAVAAVAVVGLGLATGQQGSCERNGPGSECVLPVGPGGQQVTDRFTFVHQPLTGDGSITARVTSMTGQLYGGRTGLAPWAKAGLIVKDGTRPGSTYAAVMVTGGHGVRMQHDYTHDRAGSRGALPRWLRLTRTGDTVTGYDSSDGVKWSTVGAVRLPELPPTVQIGLFTTSPQYAEMVSQAIGSIGTASGPSRATATFDHLDREGPWTDDVVGRPDNAMGEGAGVEQTADGFTLTGSGDIAPMVAGAVGIGATITHTLIGTFAGLIIMVVVGTLFVTAEYRRGLIRTTLAAVPRRGRALAAKALVLGAVTFLIGLVAATVAVTVGQRVLRGNGVYLHPVTTFTALRVVVGTAALLAVAAVLALGLGVLLRRGATAVAAAVALTVLPYLLAVAAFPTGAGQWLLRVTPAAAFAIQQSATRYAQVDNVYLPADGYFPLPPWAGFGVLIGWAALALGLAAYRIRRSDA